MLHSGSRVHTQGGWLELDAVPRPALTHLPQRGAGDGGWAHKPTQAGAIMHQSH